jgi:hypothetical protein
MGSLPSLVGAQPFCATLRIASTLSGYGSDIDTEVAAVVHQPRRGLHPSSRE